MREQGAKAAILLAGYRVTFWQFLVNAAVAYTVAAVLMVLCGPMGMLASMLIGTAMTAILVFGLLLFARQRPGTAIVVVLVLAILHLVLLGARIHGGLFWLVWSKPGLHWMEGHGF
jgi:hypothetical protein